MRRRGAEPPVGPLFGDVGLHWRGGGEHASGQAWIDGLRPGPHFLVVHPRGAAQERYLSCLPRAIDVLADATDPDGSVDPATLEIVRPPAEGTAEIDAVSGKVR